MGLIDKLKEKVVNPDQQVVQAAQNEQAAQEFEQYALGAWLWLRQELDSRAQAYLSDPHHDALLSDLLCDHALTFVRGYLDELRNQGLKWNFAERAMNANMRVEVAPRSAPNTFTLTEYFDDFSQLTRQGQVVSEAGGRGRALRASIKVDVSSGAYWISDVVLVSAS